MNLTISTYPRKGTETALGWPHPWGTAPISTYPRKGTETSWCPHQCSSHCRFQLIPARGRKLGAADLLPACIQFQLIPARGQKQSLSNKHSNCHNFNLSPQNPLRRCAPALPKGELLQLPFTPMLSSPFGGAGTALAVPERVLPARGRKPRFSGTAAARNGHFNLSPQGDGNLRHFYQPPPSVPISTYPRKGTETIHHR